jgi:arabinofuranosyltransferase
MDDGVHASFAHRSRLATWLPCVIPVVVVLAYRSILTPHFADDAFITFTYAQNLATGLGAVFNAGERVFGSTSPLWMLLLAAGRLLGFDVLHVAVVLGVLFECALACSLVALGRELLGSSAAGIVLAVLVVSNPVFLMPSVTGMETALFLFLLVLSLVLLAQSRDRAALCVAALCVWARFDAILFLALALLFVVLKERGRIRWTVVAPSLLVLAAYFLFGWIYYGDLVPSSVQAKMVGHYFSSGWMARAGRVAIEFWNAFLGRSNYWYVADSALRILWVPLVIGAIALMRKRAVKVIPLVAFSVAYAGAFILAGRTYAIHFPWYFVPPLLLLYLVVAQGVLSLVKGITRFLSSNPRTRQTITVSCCLMVAVGWAFLMVVPLQKNETRLVEKFFEERERTYAAVGLWLGDILPRGSVVAAVEIGAIRFFSPQRLKILDLGRLILMPADRGLDFRELVVRKRPEVVVARSHFPHRKEYEKLLPNVYEWHEFRTVNIGIRSDLAEAMTIDLERLQERYTEVDLREEPDAHHP